MARPRSELSAKLHEFCGNVYFQPPANKSLSFPCIVYSLSRVGVVFADNGPYRTYDEYSVTYITRDPDDVTIHELALLSMCRMTNTGKNDNLHHYYYQLYY